MENFRKTAIVLLSLDESIRTEVLSHLPRETAEQLTVELARTDEVSQQEQDQAISEFQTTLAGRTEIEPVSRDLVNESSAVSPYEDVAKDNLDNVRRSIESTTPFAFLHRLSAEDVLSGISNEHPQTVALILSYLPTNLAADVLARIPPDRQLDVVQRIAGMEQTSPEIIREIEASLKTRMADLFNQEPGYSGGIPIVAQILNVADQETSRGILEGLEQKSEVLGEEIQRLMFVFEDLIRLDDKAIQS